ncbi:MAG: TetR/AcrR family transcriptional regulator [Eubacteriales bacterium]|nr:TetR/AcrR family transcriptional regulator [Eubacteriales bacterium]
MEPRERILEAAFGLFSKIGYSAVTMDQLAVRLGMSKATLYKYFPSKKELILACVDGFSHKVEAEINAQLADPGLSPRERMNRFMLPVLRVITKINKEALIDLQRNVPEAYDKIEAARRRILLHSIVRVIEEGKTAGLLRNNVSASLAAHTLIGAVSHLSEPAVLEELELPLGQLLSDVLNLLWEGLLSERGRTAEP